MQKTVQIIHIPLRETPQALLCNLLEASGREYAKSLHKCVEKLAALRSSPGLAPLDATPRTCLAIAPTHKDDEFYKPVNKDKSATQARK